MKKPDLANAGEEKKDPRKNYVEPPEGFDLPKIEEGETFEMVAEITRTKDGYCVSAWDGIAVEKEEDDEEQAEVEESIGAGAKRAMQREDY